MNKILLVCASMLVCALTNAQNISINGHVKEASGTAVVSATVSLLKATDTSWVTSTLSGDKGDFSFTGIAKGEYLIDVTALGYKKNIQPVNGSSSIEILLSKVSNELEEVVIKSNHPTIQSGLGKLTLNFEQARVNAGSNVLDLLRKSPGVTVDGNSNISLQGSGVLVLINDKQTYLSGQQLADYLKSLSAEQVAQLELITQPSSRYDAEGSGGIINIKTKKNLKIGYSGTIDLSASQGVYPSTHNTGNLNYNALRTNLYANGGYLRGNGFMTRTDTRKVYDGQTGDVLSEAVQDVDRHEVFGDANLQLGGDYRVNDKLTVGGSAKGIYHPNDEEDHTQTAMTDRGTVINNSTHNSLGFRRNHYIFNAFGNYTLAKNHSISVDADYLYRDQKNFQNITSENLDAGMQPVPGGQTLRNNAPSVIKTAVAKADYAGTVKDVKIEAGVKTSYANVRNGAFIDRFENNAWTPDTTRTNDFLYKENINAAYVNATKDFGTKWKAQAGLRVENANIEGDELTQGNGFSRSNTNLFPTAFVSYKMDDKNSFELNCGRRIDRPSYTELNPFVFIYSQYYYYSGNTNLKPSFRDYLEFKYNHNNKIFASAGYRNVTDLITPVIFYDSATKATYATWGNFADRNVLAGSVNINDPLFEWWLFNGSADFYYNDFYNSSGHLANSFGYSVAVSNQFTLPHGWSVDSTIFYASGDLQNLVDRYGPSWWMDLNVAKKFWSDKATIKLSMQDPFGVNRYSSTTNFNNIATTSSFRYASQQFSLGFTYSFGKTAENAKHQLNIEETSRM